MTATEPATADPTARRRGPRALLAAVDVRLTAPGPAYRLRAVHTLVALVVGLRLATRDWTAIADRPAVLTTHANLAGWLPAPLPPGALVALQLAGLLGVVLVVVRRLPHVGFVLAWVCYAALTALWGASGKVMHNDVLTVTVGVVLLFASVPPRGTPPDARAVRWGWPPRAALAVLATVYLLTGVQKLRHSGPDWVLSDNLAWVLRQGSSPFGPELTHLVADRVWLAQLFAAGALLLELTAPVWLAVRRTRAPFALAVLVMHGSIWAFLGLDYSAWVLTAAAVTVPMSLADGHRWVGLLGRLRSRPVQT